MLWLIQINRFCCTESSLSPAEALGRLAGTVCAVGVVAGGHVSGRLAEVIVGVSGAARAPEPPPPLPLHLLRVFHRPLAR